MITLLVFLVGGGVLGFLAGRPSEKRLRCGAFGLEKTLVFGGVWKDVDHRCRERVDPRCRAGYCTVHCRHKDRCDGLCLKEIA